ncbi:MAG: hypothetical protein K2N72_02255 [Oscillospiraceae bacterium]|nr:hypothetical protein [Oscillospiraceae bacterium]
MQHRTCDECHTFMLPPVKGAYAEALAEPLQSLTAASKVKRRSSNEKNVKNGKKFCKKEV